MKRVNKIAVVSLSKGILGEAFVAHELELGKKRIKELGVELCFMPNALKGLEYLDNHPEERAKDLLQAFKDPSIDMILCAIGGDDTYRLLPYLFENDELKNAVSEKIFLGFSDSTINHLMLNKVGLRTFYGQAFLSDVCELSSSMLPYSKNYFHKLITTGKIDKIVPSSIWYDSREDFSANAIGTTMKEHSNEGFILLQGSSIFSGKILGGCIDTIYDIFDGTRYKDSPELCKKYSLFPSLDEWKGKILLLESSEEKASAKKYSEIIKALRNYGIFDVINGLLIGQPMDRTYEDEYFEILKNEVGNKNLSIVANINVGHSTPRCIIPFGVTAHVDTSKQVIEFEY